MRQVSLDDLHTLAEQAKPQLVEAAGRIGRPIKIYIHWTYDHYDQEHPEYHINVFQDGQTFITTDNLSEYKLHTSHRNGGSISIAATCAYDAKDITDLGPEPPTECQIEAIAQIVAALAAVLDIPIDLVHVLTHAEAADNLDGESRWHPPYGPRSASRHCRHWDFWTIKAEDEAGSGGNTLRGKALWYQHNNSSPEPAELI